MNILHTESSAGWGGQEIRILRESEGLRSRGHEIIIAAPPGSGLAIKAKEKGFIVYEIDFKKTKALFAVARLLNIFHKHNIDCVNTHSSMDAWIAGIAARIASKKIVRTRHLSTPIRKGLNSRLLYKMLADHVVTTSSCMVPVICRQANISPSVCCSIPTGVDPDPLKISSEEVKKFRQELGLKEGDFLVGTACFVRSWKGIKDFMRAASLLKEFSDVKWVIVGGGYVDEYRGFAEELKLEGTLFFTGHLESPFAAMAAMDVFALLSTAHEGVSQASLQAAFLERPLLTTDVGGLPEVCIPGTTGIIVPPFSPEKIASSVLELKANPERCLLFGKNAKKLVEEKFTFLHTLNRMEKVFIGV
ncbi:MAG: glycosyltransferase family 4 protein [Chlamydiota bacterium]